MQMMWQEGASTSTGLGGRQPPSRLPRKPPVVFNRNVSQARQEGEGVAVARGEHHGVNARHAAAAEEMHAAVG